MTGDFYLLSYFFFCFPYIEYCYAKEMGIKLAPLVLWQVMSPEAFIHHGRIIRVRAGKFNRI
jgi:hypothetical protein